VSDFGTGEADVDLLEAVGAIASTAFVSANITPHHL